MRCFCSGSSIPASKVYEEEGIIQVSPASTNPKLTDEGGPNVFRVCGRDDQQEKWRVSSSQVFIAV